jgi:hypothetical protein
MIDESEFYDEVRVISRVGRIKKQIITRTWKKTFLFWPRIIDKKVHWCHTVYSAPDYFRGGFEYKTQKQYIIDELKGKN